MNIFKYEELKSFMHKHIDKERTNNAKEFTRREYSSNYLFQLRRE